MLCKRKREKREREREREREEEREKLPLSSFNFGDKGLIIPHVFMDVINLNLLMLQLSL